jgi:8-oxo-dGTP diphosphatase
MNKITMKHYVLGFVFDGQQNVILIQKDKPEWMAGRWNGIGGKIEPGESPEEAIDREAHEEIGRSDLEWYHQITYVSPSGTMFVFAAFTPELYLQQPPDETEQAAVFCRKNLPTPLMENLEWMIPLCRAELAAPAFVHCREVGTSLA